MLTRLVFVALQLLSYQIFKFNLYFQWVDSSQQVFQVVLIVTSFVLSWGEAWFLDCRVIPQERHARNYFSAITSMNSDRSPLLAPFLQSIGDPPTAESVANFYSPYDSISHSDEEDEQVSVLEVIIIL